MRTNLKLFCTAMLLAGTVFSWAQEKNITGQVTDSNGFPVTEAYVYVEGTDNGVYTDANGNYSLNVNQGDTVVVEFVGLETKTISVGAGNNYAIQLTKGGTIALDKVIALGYSTTTDEAYTGTADVVNSEAIEKKSVSNVSQALAGESAGVRVINSSGQPGETASVRIRGIGSVNGNTSPLYVVDGVPFEGSINSINPSDIENTIVLKDATATAIYGSRGANGVIVINTKKGKKGSSNISFESRTGFNLNILPRYSTIKSPEEYMEIGWDGLRNYAILNNESDPRQWASDNLFGDASGQGIVKEYNLWNKPGNQLIDPKTGKFFGGISRKYNPENWEDYAFSPSLRNENNVRISGGSDNTSFYTSFGYLNDKGYSIKSDFNRLSTRLNLDHKVNDWIKASVNVGYAYSDRNVNGQSSDSQSIFWFVDNIPSIYPLYQRDDKGNLIADPFFKGNYVYDYGDLGRRFGKSTNAISDAQYNTKNGKKHDFNGSANLDFDLFKNITFTFRAGTQFFTDTYNSIGNPYYGGAAGETHGSVSKVKRDLLNFNALEMLKYSNTFDNKHGLNVLVAHENYSSVYNVISNYNTGIIVDDLPELSNTIKRVSSNSYKVDYTLESYFGQLEYNFNKKYYLTGTFRNDGSSRFLNNKWGKFWSVGAGWVVSKEDFLIDSKIFDYMKLKSSYGITGEQAWGSDEIGLNEYTGYNIYDVKHNGIYDFSFDFPGSPDLTWEKSTMVQVGVELGIAKVLDINLDYYRKNTNNLLFERRVAPSVGYAIEKANDGELLNTGLEFDINADLFKNDNFFFNVGINGEVLHNELLAMPIEPGTGKQKVIDIKSIYGRSVGHSIYDYYLQEWAGVDTKTGEALWNQYFDDANGNGQLDSNENAIVSLTDYLSKNPNAKVAKQTTNKYADATQKYVGKSAVPDVRGAFNLSTGVSNFEVSVQLLYSLGGYSYDSAYASLMTAGIIGGNNWHTDIRDRWQNPGDVTDIPRLANNYGTDSKFSSSSTRFLTKSDYLSVNNVRIGYNLPKSYVNQVGISDLSIYVQGDNLWLFSKRKGFNPSVSLTGSSSSYTYSPLSNFTFGVKVKL